VTPIHTKTAFITGASTGIGAACASELARRGWAVFAGVRKPGDGEALEALGENIRAVRVDVTDPESIAQAAQTVEAQGGQAGLQGLVNNAGIVVAGPLEFVPLDQFRRQLEVNVTGHLAVTQAFLGILRQGRGRIVNMGSISGRMAAPFLGPYAASKHAMEALTDALRRELQPWGIHVSVIEPGAVRTPIWRKSSEAAESMMQDMPPEAGVRYGDAIAQFRKATGRVSASAVPVERVTRKVLHALTARRPRARYLVGLDATVQAWGAKWLPDRVFDRIMAAALARMAKKG
jgi:NAD(P)-dependent dehydrogenase (short-subunit alcohol dehydrogenase family)